MITAADIQTIRDADPGAVLPGIDTMTGNPYAASSLLDVTKISPARGTHEAVHMSRPWDICELVYMSRPWDRDSIADISTFRQ